MSAITQRLSANGLNFAIDTLGEGDTVALCLHGFPEARQAWSEQLPALADLGWRAVAPDLRGYGDSDRPTAQVAYRIDRLVEDVEALFTSLGAKRRILIGHDWGGIIAWQVALRRPGLLDGLVILNAPHPAVYRAAYNAGWRQKLKSWYVLAFMAPKAPELALTAQQGRGFIQSLKRQSPGFTNERLEVYRRNLIQPGAATAMINYYRANIAELGVGPIPTAPIACPTLMIWGDNDPFLDVSLTEGNEAHVRDFTLHRLPGVSHWVCEDASPEVNRLMAEWASAKGLAA